MTLPPGVFLHQPRYFQAQDATSGILVENWTSVDVPLPEAGELVRVNGHLRLHSDGALRLRACEVEIIGAGEVVQPRAISLLDASAGTHAGELVSIDGRVSDVSESTTTEAMYLSDSTTLVRAYIRRASGEARKLAHIERGYRVRVTGISRPRREGAKFLYQVRLMDATSVSILSRPLISAERGLQILGAVVFALMAVSLALLVRMRRIDNRRMAQVEALLSKEKEVSDLKSQFMANMSHEVRTPLNGILGMAQLTLATPLTSAQREYLRTIETSGRSLLVIISDILDYSRIAAGKLDLNVGPFHLREPFERSMAPLRLAAAEKGLSLETAVDELLPNSLRGDGVRLNQVLTNIVHNAVKFTDQGGISVNVRAAESSENSVLAEFTVTDTGIGIAADQLETIFDPFVQADRSSTRRFGGTGLGLAISKRLVAAMGGSIRAESRIGHGSSFVFTIPLEIASDAEVDDPGVDWQVPDAGVGQSVRVLLAEDDLVSQRLVEAVIERAGWEVVSVGNGREAVDAVREQDIDVVLMDVNMPEMDGLEATAEIRREKPELPIIALTAAATKGDRERCLAAGMTDYLAKPVACDHLLTLVRRAVLDQANARFTSPASGQELDAG